MLRRFSATIQRPLAMPTMSRLANTARFCAASTGSVAGKVKVTFIDGRKTTTPPQRTECAATIGDTLLTTALANQLDIEAACDGTCACSTCHVYVDDAHFKALPAASEDEMDMLDLAAEQRHNSRLCCQLTVTKDFDGMELTLPDEVSNNF